MIFVHSSTVAAILCQLPATNNPKTVGGMCYAIIGMIGLTPHHGTNYKYPPVMAMLTRDTLGYAAVINRQLQARKARHYHHASVKPDKLSLHAKCRQAIQACKVQTSYPSMHSKRHYKRD